MSEWQDKWVREYLQPRYPELVPSYLKATEIVDSALKSGFLAPDHMDLLSSFARSPRSPLGENVASMIGVLADHFEVARDAVRTLASNAKLHARVNALVALSSHARSGLHNEILSAALTDRSSKVRELAADKIMGFGLRELLPEIESAIEREEKTKTRATLEWERDLLRDGFRAIDQSNGSIRITCRTKGGVISTSFSNGEFETKGREWIAKHRRAD